jgi:hypothetical protein
MNVAIEDVHILAAFNIDALAAFGGVICTAWSNLRIFDSDVAGVDNSNAIAISR